MKKRFFDITSENEGAVISVTEKPGDDTLKVYHVAIKFEKPVTPKPVRILWEEPMVNILYTGRPCCCNDHTMHQWWAPTVSSSKFCFGAPYLYTVGDKGINAQTVAVSDPVTPLNISYCVNDFPQKYRVAYYVTFFSETTGLLGEIDSYEADIRIDTRPLPYYECVRSVYAWWCEYGYQIPAIPAAAEDALYSSWYNFHQVPEQNRLLRDLTIAAELGFKTVILDDGWQFEGQPSGGHYSTCGDWQIAKDKFPDFGEFVKQVHALGMKLIVWFAVPFVGVVAKNFEKFREKSLYFDSGCKALILDPRYPEVRAYIVKTYADFLRAYDIDGFKLDFVDSFRPGDTTKPYCPETMDYVSVGDAVRALLTEIVTTLDAVKPELLYEYRQNYVGPAINRFGNMLRVGDCAYDACINRMVLIDLRLLNYPVAVHSDMLYWAKEESLTLCAKQLLNILFSVPQISVILADSTAEQKALLKHYLAYWTANKDLILHGEFKVYHPESNYTMVTAEDDQRLIAVLYADVSYVWQGKACDVFHNGDTDGLLFENPTALNLTADCYDCLGKKLATVSVPAGTLLRLPVPRTGMAHIAPAGDCR